MEHTPTPWTIAYASNGCFDIVGAKNKQGYFPVICTLTIGGDYWKNTDYPATQKANGLFIERAVNCHDELVAALQSVWDSVPFSSYRGDGELEECEQRVRAALANAGH